MPIPNQSSLDFLGIPALQGSNKQVRGDYEPRILRTGTMIKFVDAAGVVHTSLIGNVAGTAINVTLTDGSGHRTEYTGVPYDSGGSNYSWRWTSE